jgi:hypothetical protein
MDTSYCKRCEQHLTVEHFYFRKDTNKYHTSCKKCLNKDTWDRHKNGNVKKRVEFDFVCIQCSKQQTPECYYLKDKKTLRYDTTCKTCRVDGAKTWHRDNREQSLQNKKQWHIDNRDRLLESFRNKYARTMLENPESIREQRKKWRK